jgi:hypothetical protein
MTNLTPNYFNPAGPALAIYNRFRIPPKPPVEDTVSQPGHLCWGSVGALPTAEPLPVTGFNTVEPEERNEELERKSTTIRVEQEGNPQNYVLIDRADEILFKTRHPGWKTATGTNTDGASDFGDFAPTPIELTAFVPLGTEKQGRLIVKFNNTTSRG